ncbi:PadR family transcriptional regulator [bacterium]|nr:PadR family transcriptional regulator [bacterium]
MKLTMTEQILLLAIWHLTDEATSYAIRKHFNEITGRDVAFGTIYNNMDQLIRKGYASSKKGSVESGRGGRPKIYYKLTDEGRTALQQAQDFKEKLWAGLPRGIFNREL